MSAIHRCIIGIIGCFVGLSLALGPVLAQTRQSHASFLTPFPQGDVYRVLVIGDWIAQGLQGGLQEAFHGDQRLDLKGNRIEFKGVMRGEFEAGLSAVKAELSRTKYNIAIVLMSSFDRVSLRTREGRLAVGSEGWNRVFGDRIEAIMRTLRQADTAVYWVGLPIMQGEHRNEDARAMNEVLRQRAYRNGVRFIDIFRATASDDGEYSAYGPDLSGTVRLLRFKDGVHFTQSGYAKLAHFIERQLNRDLGEARSERDTPLAGNDAEQQRVLALAVPVGKDASKMQAAGEGRGQETGGHRGGQPADSARLTLSVKGANGRVQRTTVDLLRPAIAGSVIAVLTRGQSDDRPSKVGLTISDELPNGLLVLRSITPSLAVREGANRLPASQLPFFRVLVKGERPTPVEGRADDFRWPRDDRTLPSDVRMAARPANVVTPRAQPMPQWDPSIPPLPRRKPLRLSPDAPFSPRLE